MDDIQKIPTDFMFLFGFTLGILMTILAQAFNRAIERDRKNG